MNIKTALISAMVALQAVQAAWPGPQPAGWTAGGAGTAFRPKNFLP